MSEQRMKILPKSSTQVPAPRGPLMDAVAIARDLFYGNVEPKWVKQNVPNKVKLGHSTVLWYRDDVLAFIESRREESAA